MNDTDGPIPINEFFERYNKILYSAIRRSLRTRDHDEIMDAMVDEFAIRYEALVQNFHPDFGVPFSQPQLQCLQ